MARIQDLLRKEVINLFTGEKLGFASDVELDVDSGRIAAIILPEKGKGLSLFGRSSELVVPWADIQRISDDLIMINTDTSVLCRRESKT